MPSEEALRLTALLTPALGDWLYEPAAQCAAGRAPDPAWVIGRGAPKDLDDPDTFWAAFGRYLATKPPLSFNLGANRRRAEVWWRDIGWQGQEREAMAALRHAWTDALEFLAAQGGAS